MIHQPYHPKSPLSESPLSFGPPFSRLKDKEDGAGEIAQHLTALVAFAEDLRSSLSIHMVAHNHT